MDVSRDEIYLINFPFSDYRESKKRPVLVISNNSYNKEEPDVIVCGITTNSDHRWFFSLDEKKIANGKLYPGSGVRVDMLGRVEKNELKSRIGKIESSAHKQVIEKINQIIG